MRAAGELSASNACSSLTLEDDTTFLPLSFDIAGAARAGHRLWRRPKSHAEGQFNWPTDAGFFFFLLAQVVC